MTKLIRRGSLRGGEGDPLWISGKVLRWVIEMA